MSIPQNVQNSDAQRSLTVGGKIGIGFFGLILLLALCMGYALYKLVNIKNEAVSVIDHRQPVSILYLQLSENVNIATTLLNGYLLTGYEENKLNYRALVAEFPEILHSIQHHSNIHMSLATHSMEDEDLVEIEQLLNQFTDYANQLLTLRDNDEKNYPGLVMASNLLNPYVLEYIGLVNEFVEEEDQNLTSNQNREARSILYEMRYSWIRMINSLRMYFSIRAVSNLENFNNYSELNGELIHRLELLGIDLGFDGISRIKEIRKKSLEIIPKIIAIYKSDAWRADVHLMRTEVQGLVKILRDKLEKLANQQVIASKASGKSLEESIEDIRVSSIISLVVALAIGTILWAFITRSIVPSITKLMNAAHSVSHGELDTQVTIEANDEIGMLATSFNKMINDLRTAELDRVKYLDDLVELNSTLEQKVEQRTEELSRSEIRTRAVLENIGEGIIVINNKGFIESTNVAAINIFGMSDNYTKNIHCSLLIGEDHISEKLKSQGDEYIDERDGIFSIESANQLNEYKGKRLDGHVFPMEILVTILQLGDERKRVCIVRDITKRKETENKLSHAQQQLVDSAHNAGMAEMATGVLHNIGNILNSVNLSGQEINRVVAESKIDSLLKANGMLSEHLDKLGTYLTSDKKGKLLPQFYLKIGNTLKSEINQIGKETGSLIERLTMMREVISTQQNYAHAGFLNEELDITNLIEDAITVIQASLINHGVEIKREYEDIPLCTIQKSKMIQIVTNIIKNAVEAMNDNDLSNKQKILTIKLGMAENNTIKTIFTDNGCGIGKDNLTKIFNHGFTTKKEGHGFGLHTCANAMTEMGGSISIDSEGVECGSSFTLYFPVSTKQEDETDYLNISNG